MGHFERGAWVETPRDKLEQSCIQLGESLREPFQNLFSSICEALTKPTDIFRQGRALSLSDLAGEIYSKRDTEEDKGEL